MPFSDCKTIFNVYVPFLRLDVIQDVVTTLSDKCGSLKQLSEAELRVVFSSSCHTLILVYSAWHGHSVKRERVRKFEIERVQIIRKETKLKNMPFKLLECSDN